MKLIFLYTAAFIFFLNGMEKQIPEADPTGTYQLGKNPAEEEDIYGYFGKIQVKSISASQIVMTFYICKGAPSYNSGAFVDTLTYAGNKSVYIPGDDIDPSCEITFEFTDMGVKVNEQTEDFNSGCGFGHAVVAKGYFKKISAEVPELKDPLTDEAIK